MWNNEDRGPGLTKRKAKSPEKDNKKLCTGEKKTISITTTTVIFKRFSQERRA